MYFPTIVFFSVILTAFSLASMSIGDFLRTGFAPRSGLRRWIPLFLALLILVVYAVLRYAGLFQATQILGAADDIKVLVVAAIAVVFGILIGALVDAGSPEQFQWSKVVIPIVASPLFIAPVWKMYTDLNISTPEFRHYVTFFFSGVTNGYTWRSILEKLRK
jgi:hypothetical protein